MRKDRALKRWDAAVKRYLDTRHALGRAYRSDEHVLHKLRSFLLRAGRRDLDRESFEAWRGQFVTLSLFTRVRCEQTVFRFCRYRQRTEPQSFLPDRTTLAKLKGYPLPTVIEPHQIESLLRYVSGRRPTPQYPLRPKALRVAVVLLYTAGLRRGELVRLTLGDVDSDAGVLHIRESKFHKSRWVPLSDSATVEVRTYLAARRHAGFSEAKTAPLLCRSRGLPYSGDCLHGIMKRALGSAGIRSEAGRVPRVHDFRHSFAVEALRRWYEKDEDVQSHLPKLALYMGHVSIASTAYYLRSMPAVVAQASDRFGRAFEKVLQGGAS